MALTSKSSGRLPRECGPAALRRLLRIQERMNQGAHVSASTLSTELEVSVRTIKRDIETLRHEHGAEIIWEPITATYVCTKPSEQLPLLHISADEATAIALAGKTFAAWGGTPLGKALNSALTKIARVVGNSVSVPLATITECISQAHTEDPVANIERQHFARLVDAINKKQCIRISYRKPRSNGPEERILNPLHLTYLEHAWMLVAHDVNRNALRNFVLSRMGTVILTGRTFTPPKDFKPAEYLAGAFGRHIGQTETEVRIQFDSYAAPFIRERSWHHTQQVTEAADGEIMITMRVSHLLDVQRWVLSWGSHAVVLGPEALRTSISVESSRIQKSYT